VDIDFKLEDKVDLWRRCESEHALVTMGILDILIELVGKDRVINALKERGFFDIHTKGRWQWRLDKFGRDHDKSK